MKRINLYLLIALGAVLLVALTACESSPKARTDEFVKYLPEEVGDWELDDTVKLQSSTVSSQGHAILKYAGDDDAVAWIVVQVFASDDAGQVAAADRERELLLSGLELEANRSPQHVTAQVGQTDRARFALFEDSGVVVEVNALAAPDADAPVSDEAFDTLLTLVRNAYDKVTAEE